MNFFQQPKNPPNKDSKAQTTMAIGLLITEYEGKDLPPAKSVPTITVSSLHCDLVFQVPEKRLLSYPHLLCDCIDRASDELGMTPRTHSPIFYMTSLMILPKEEFFPMYNNTRYISNVKNLNGGIVILTIKTKKGHNLKSPEVEIFIHPDYVDYFATLTQADLTTSVRPIDLIKVLKENKIIPIETNNIQANVAAFLNLQEQMEKYQKDRHKVLSTQMKEFKVPDDLVKIICGY